MNEEEEITETMKEHLKYISDLSITDLVKKFNEIDNLINVHQTKIRLLILKQNVINNEITKMLENETK